MGFVLGVGDTHGLKSSGFGGVSAAPPKAKTFKMLGVCLTILALGSH